MFNCSTHVVECLRNNNIYPKAISPVGNPDRALNYTEANRFEGNTGETLYMYVDFKVKINISSYQIRADSGCNWISKWDIFLSNNSFVWTNSVSSHIGFTNNSVYEIDTPQVARYFKISGETPKCSLPKYFAFYWLKIFGSGMIESLVTSKFKRNYFDFITSLIIFIIMK